MWRLASDWLENDFMHSPIYVYAGTNYIDTSNAYRGTHYIFQIKKKSI